LTITRDSGYIISTVDSDLDSTLCTVNASDIERFVYTIANIEIVEVAVGRERPVTISVDAEVTDSAGYCVCSEGIIGIVDIGASERTTGTDSCIGLCQCLSITANGCCVIRTINRNLNRAGCTVNTGDVKCLID